MSYNFTASQAAQGANYAGRAMNGLQTAVNIDDQQAHPEGTTFWFRWFIRVVAVTTGLRKFSLSNDKTKHNLRYRFFSTVAMLCGLFGALSISPFCIIAGVMMMYVLKLF